MPERLKERIEGSLRGKRRYKGRTAEQSAYAIMNKMGAMKGSKTTAKGWEMERKRKLSDTRGRSDRGEVLSTG